jgi:hypothetical protein
MASKQENTRNVLGTRVHPEALTCIYYAPGRR